MKIIIDGGRKGNHKRGKREGGKGRGGKGSGVDRRGEGCDGDLTKGGQERSKKIVKFRIDRRRK